MLEINYSTTDNFNYQDYSSLAPVYCPFCDYEGDLEYKGTWFKCPKCGQLFREISNQEVEE
jgi:predicted RNA-binding Zn-ribbon protein involved in translation (DUF1610 family)